MKVHVRIQGAMAKPFGKDDFDHELTDGADLEDLLVGLGYHRAHLRFILAAVKSEQKKLGDRLADGDEIVLFLPTSGG